MQTSARKLTQAVQPNERTASTAKHAQGANCTETQTVQPNGEKAARQNTQGRTQPTGSRTRQHDERSDYGRSDTTDGTRTSGTNGRSQPTGSRTLHSYGRRIQPVGRNRRTAERYNRWDTYDSCAAEQNRRAAERCTATGGRIQPMGHVRRTGRNPDSCAAEQLCGRTTTNEGAYIQRPTARTSSGREDRNERPSDVTGQLHSRTNEGERTRRPERKAVGRNRTAAQPNKRRRADAKTGTKGRRT